jgi:hypothetical protein
MYNLWLDLHPATFWQNGKVTFIVWNVVYSYPYRVEGLN